MRPTETHNTEQVVKEADFPLETERSEAIKAAMLAAYNPTASAHRAEPLMWRCIMRSPLLKIGIPAAAVLLFIFLAIFSPSVEQAWAIEQTVEAMGRLQTLRITGVDYWDGEAIPFTFAIRFHEADEFFDMRFESAKQTVVVRDKEAWAYQADANIVKYYNDVTDSRGMMRDLQFCYKFAALNPWINGKVFPVLKAFANTWEEQYPTEGPYAGRVVVYGRYEPLNNSFQMVCDLETKYILEGSFWRNARWEGDPALSAQHLVYNEAIAEEVFDFEIPRDAHLIDEDVQAAAKEQFARGETLFQQKQYPEAIAVFEQIAGHAATDPRRVHEALMMIGICYGYLADHETAIAFYEKAVTEYGFKGWSEATYFYLGCAYLDTGQKDKARTAFQNALILGEGVRKPDVFPMKEARQILRRLDEESRSDDGAAPAELSPEGAV